MATVLVLFAGSAAILSGCDSGGSGMDAPENTITDLVTSSDNLTTIAAALQATGRAETLNNPDATFTVFAPADAAFENVDVQSLTNNPDLLGTLLDYHVVPGEALTASDLQGRTSVTTVEGQDLPISEENGTLTVGGVPVTQADLEASNGVAHVIDGVLVPDSFPQRISYDLEAQSNGGAIPEGVDATVTFWEAGPDQTLITLSLDNGPTGASVSHPAHIHAGTASESGPIEIYLSPLDGTNANDANDGTSARLVDRPFSELANFDGYVNIHESVANLQNVVSQGNIGANDPGLFGAGLQLTDNPQTITYPLPAQANNGAIPNGVPGELQLTELTGNLTLATVRLDPDGDGQFEDGATGAGVSHPAHIHDGSVAESPGPIQVYLSPVDGTDSAARSSKIVEQSFGDLSSIDGYVNVHESAAALQNVVSQGNVGANAGDGGGSAADVTVTLSNVGSSAWEVTSVDGASGIAGSGENPSLTLTVGTRYRFVNNGGSSHPLGFQNASAEYLLNQNGSGSLESDSAINYVEDDEGVTFTYTQALADAVATYRCAIHSSMEGTVQTNGS